ncbi:hypothetical protein WICPIJ_000961 [Wickerhamomyces pijperi]|uniref:Uncharacterized protein n=1 Tax=Wickerhamomyces pijperi TaxID=599730 RepID=A0A9P8TQD5_WICPI|nr:hypothetical protein WICPIJ_000961 [Wickerhamomyces pijperi]
MFQHLPLELQISVFTDYSNSLINSTTSMTELLVILKNLAKVQELQPLISSFVHVLAVTNESTYALTKGQLLNGNQVQTTSYTKIVIPDELCKRGNVEPLPELNPAAQKRRVSTNYITEDVLHPIISNRKKVLIIELHDYTTRFKDQVMLYRLPTQIFTTDIANGICPNVRVHIDVVNPKNKIHEMIDLDKFREMSQGSNHPSEYEKDQCELQRALTQVLPPFKPFSDSVDQSFVDWVLGRETPNEPIKYNSQYNEVTIKTYGNLSNAFVNIKHYIKDTGLDGVCHSEQDFFDLLLEVGTLGYAGPMFDICLLTETMEPGHKVTGVTGVVTGCVWEWSRENFNNWGHEDLMIYQLLRTLVYSKVILTDYSALTADDKKSIFTGANFSLDLVFVEMKNPSHGTDGYCSVQSAVKSFQKTLTKYRNCRWKQLKTWDTHATSAFKLRLEVGMISCFYAENYENFLKGFPRSERVRERETLLTNKFLKSYHELLSKLAGPKSTDHHGPGSDPQVIRFKKFVNETDFLDLFKLLSEEEIAKGWKYLKKYPL